MNGSNFASPNPNEQPSTTTSSVSGNTTGLNSEQRKKHLADAEQERTEQRRLQLLEAQKKAEALREKQKEERKRRIEENRQREEARQKKAQETKNEIERQYRVRLIQCAWWLCLSFLNKTPRNPWHSIRKILS